MPPFVRARLDYYTVLEIDRSADTAEINAAFRRLAWRYHPDLNHAPGATLQFQDINEAHQVLSDPAKREQYDSEWHPVARPNQGTSRRTVRSHSHRSSRRRRRYRAGVLTVCAFVFVSSAWALLFTALGSGHFAVASESSEAPSSVSAEASPNCGFTMEMFPVTYTDEHGRQSTGWETDVRNCWGGPTTVSSVPSGSRHGTGRFLSDSSYGWIELR